MLLHLVKFCCWCWFLFNFINIKFLMFWLDSFLYVIRGLFTLYDFKQFRVYKQIKKSVFIKHLLIFLVIYVFVYLLFLFVIIVFVFALMTIVFLNKLLTLLIFSKPWQFLVIVFPLIFNKFNNYLYFSWNYIWRHFDT